MIAIKNTVQQDGIRHSADLLSAVFRRIDGIVQPGVTTHDIDCVVEETIRAGGGVPAFLGYGGFPASVCASVNAAVIHGIPNNIPLKEGDIVGFDIGVILNGYYSDACKTYTVGSVPESTQKLLDATRIALQSAIDVCHPGNRIKDIGRAVTESIQPHGFGIVYNYCGHGVGLSLHEDPQIPNYYPSHGVNPRIKAGMVLAIEPMINAGSPDVKVQDDGWTVTTADGCLSAHFEHSILITSKGPEVLTFWEK